jgi:hypothetical protein
MMKKVAAANGWVAVHHEPDASISKFRGGGMVSIAYFQCASGIKRLTPGSIRLVWR